MGVVPSPRKAQQVNDLRGREGTAKGLEKGTPEFFKTALLTSLRLLCPASRRFSNSKDRKGGEKKPGRCLVVERSRFRLGQLTPP